MKTATFVLAVFWLVLSILNMVADNEVHAAADLVISAVWAAAWYVMLYIDQQKRNSDGREH